MNRSRLAALSAGAMFLVASVFAPTAALAAGSGSLSLSQTTITTTQGSTFSVDVLSQADVAMAGASASVSFDKAKLQVVSVSKGAGWGASLAATWVLPSVADIATANTTGNLPAIAAYFTGATSLPANTSKALATVTFFATGSGTTAITLPTTGADPAAILDGTAGSYGAAVATTATGASVDITAGAVAGSASTTVSGSVDSGYLSLTCPATASLTLVRATTSTTSIDCQVGGNVTWTLKAVDNNSTAATHGYLVDAGQTPAAVLANSLHVVTGQGDTDLKASASPAQIYASQNNVTVPVTLSQTVAGNDKAGTYSMSITFQVTSSF